MSGRERIVETKKASMSIRERGRERKNFQRDSRLDLQFFSSFKVKLNSGSED